MVRLLKESEITNKHLSQIVALETKVYGKKERVKKYEEIHKKNKGVYTILVDSKDNAIACIETIPVKENTYKKLKSRKDDRCITKNSVLTKEEVRTGAPVKLYFGTIIVDPEYQNTSASFELLKSFRSKIKNLKDEGVNIDASLAHAVTINGEKACKYYGMKNIHSNVYEKNERV